MPRKMGSVYWVNMAGSYAAGWSDYGGGFQPGRFGIDELGFVHLQGLIQSGTSMTAQAVTNVYILPAGYRPAANHIFGVQVEYNAAVGYHHARVDVSSAGVIGVIPYATGVPNFLNLSGIYFLAEQ